MTSKDKDIADEIARAVELVLTERRPSKEFANRFRQLIRNAVNDNYADSDVRSLIDAAPDPYRGDK